MPCLIRQLLVVIAVLALGGCASDGGFDGIDPSIGPQAVLSDTPTTISHTSWGSPGPAPGMPPGPHAVADTDGPYLLDSGDRLRVFVYGQPNLSRVYTVDHDGNIAIPLMGLVSARGRTTGELQAAIKVALGRDYIKDPQVTVDIQQNRPFFILGEVKTAGQYPYVSGMTVETAVAIAGGYSERASSKRFRVTRRINGYVDQMTVPGDYVVLPGDTITVFERFL